MPDPIADTLQKPLPKPTVILIRTLLMSEETLETKACGLGAAFLGICDEMGQDPFFILGQINAKTGR